MKFEGMNPHPPVTRTRFSRAGIARVYRRHGRQVRCRIVPRMAPPPPAAERDTAVQPLAPPRPRPLADLLDRPETGLVAACLAVVGSLVVLLARLVPDISQKPLFADEVLAGLTAVHPFPDLFEIVLSDRGGAPLHFVLAHAALGVDGSPEALRWLSVVFALAAVPVCFDLGRRLGGLTAGAVAAIVVATSSMLAVYGTVGRMYALLAFVSALAKIGRAHV